MCIIFQHKTLLCKGIVGTLGSRTPCALTICEAMDTWHIRGAILLRRAEASYLR